jgi:two-component system sporulation sensor kinase A
MSKYKELLDSLPQTVFEFDEKGNFTFANRRGFESFGYCQEDIEKGLNVLQMVVPEDRERAKKNIRGKLSGEKFCGTEYTALRKDGSTFPVMIYSSPIIHKNRPAGLRGIVIDITERKKAEQALRESEEKYRNLFDNARDVIFTGDLKGNITQVNKAAEEYGFKKDEIVGKNHLEFVPKKHWPRILKAVEKTVRREPDEGEVELITPKGKIVMEFRGNAIERGKKVAGFHVILRDITERKKMEEKLKQYSERLEELVQKRTEELLESEKRYSVLVEEAGEGVVMAQDGKIVLANKKAQEIGGYSKEDEIIGLPIEKVVDKKYLQLVKQRHERRLQGEKVPATYEAEGIAKTGELIPVEISATRINYQGRPASLVIVRDMRERKKIEEQRLKLEKLAIIGELATMVGHDLRNPLQSIENATYYLNNELSRLSTPKGIVEMLQIIRDSVNYADNIIRDLKDFSGTKNPTLEKNDVNAIVEEVLSQVKTPKNVELIKELGCLPEIEVDKDMIKRVFLNLATNGVQAMEEKGGFLKVSTRETKNFVEVGFKDTGIGIPEKVMEKLFTPFFTTRAQGMGIGLAICKKLIDSHGGSIETESEEGKGSTFTVKLPVQQETEVKTH